MKFKDMTKLFQQSIIPTTRDNKLLYTSLLQRRWKIKTKFNIKKHKQMTYHPESSLNFIMQLHKNSGPVMDLKNLLCRQQGHTILIEDIEKEVGSIRKWELMPMIERHPRIFKVTGGHGKPFALGFADEARAVLQEEGKAREEIEPIVVNNLRKLLMMAVNWRISLQKINWLHEELRLPHDFKDTLIPKYSEHFSVVVENGERHLALKEWDSALAVTSREKGVTPSGVRFISRLEDFKDGNCPEPFGFKMCFSKFHSRMSMKEKQELQDWQSVPFSSPYSPAFALEPGLVSTDKRALAVIHELLSFTIEKRLPASKIQYFIKEFKLPESVLPLIVEHPGIFYATNQGGGMGHCCTVFLKEAFDEHLLIHKCPLLLFNERFLLLRSSRALHIPEHDDSSEWF